MKKMNNKGFSLVELIVVVLIMAIIAVALAPQVMKWVENSRVSTDCTNYESLVENLQLAIADKDVYKNVSAKEGVVCYAVIGTKGSDIKATEADVTTPGTTYTASAMPAYSTSLSAADMAKAINIGLTKIDGSWNKIAKKASAGTPAYYSIKITSGKQANVAKIADKDPATLKNGTDLS
jgi:prepilin-type N-terminal cleavage/methylation domain-containing protein